MGDIKGRTISLFLFTLLSFFIVSALALILMPKFVRATQPRPVSTPPRFWQVQAIDTMKYSRDASREFLSNPVAHQVITRQVALVATNGATHIAIATPYDDEFLPILTQWVQAARDHNLKIWFRGNWSGWEGWFDYPRITRDQHFSKTKAFIAEQAALFQDGDIFTACPECENGGDGDPRLNGDAQGHREFLIAEHDMMREEFLDINTQVEFGYNSMNGDVARLIMDPETTTRLGGVVVIDHYVKTPEKLANDISEIAEQSGGVVVLGEYGAPIPDIHGPLSPIEQAAWLEKAFTLLSQTPELIGLNYWTGVGGSTELWNANGTPRPAAHIVQSAYTPEFLRVHVTDRYKVPILAARVEVWNQVCTTNNSGSCDIPLRRQNLDTDITGKVSAANFVDTEFTHRWQTDTTAQLESPRQPTQEVTTQLIATNRSTAFKRLIMALLRSMTLQK